MITGESFWGMPLETKRQRRRLVCLYYLGLLLLGVLAVHYARNAAPILFGQTVLLGGLLGGVRSGGPVKPYGAVSPAKASGKPSPSTVDGFITLDLDARQARRRRRIQLDEREQGERNLAHFRAYRILLPSLGILTMAVLTLQALDPAWLGTHALQLLWLTLVYAVSLPQSVLLWTEPVVPEELRLVNAGARG